MVPFCYRAKEYEAPVGMALAGRLPAPSIVPSEVDLVYLETTANCEPCRRNCVRVVALFSLYSSLSGFRTTSESIDEDKTLLHEPSFFAKSLVFGTLYLG